MIWNDFYIKENCGSSFLRFYFGLICALAILAITIKAVIITTTVQDKLISVLMLFFVIVYLLSGFQQFIEGRRTLISIKFDGNQIFLKNSFFKIIFFSYKQLQNISIVSPTFTFKTPQAFIDNKSGMTIFLKNNKFYRISPHMDRFDELKAKLTEIVEQNKKAINDKE